MANRPYPSFLIYLDAAKQFRWRLEAANYKTIADSAESYHNYDDCVHGIELIKSPHEIWQTQEVTDKIS